jgi:hypothetical protein
MWPYSPVLHPTRQEDVFIESGMIDDDTLADSNSSLTLRRNEVTHTWSQDDFNAGFAIQQSVAEHTPAHLRRIVLVVDTSEAMRKYVEDIESAIRSLPSDFD